MNPKTLLLYTLLLLLLISPVIAGNNTTDIPNPTYHHEDVQTVTALESGDSNISFSDGYQGYCAEWGEHSAEEGDSFFIHKQTPNEIKTFFVYFYDEAQKDTIATQHMIWKFTDNKQFSRFNQTLYEQIVAKSKTVDVPDDGSILYNNHTKMIFSFRMFVPQIDEYQTYFGYRIFFENITENETIEINNTTDNNITLSPPILQNNQTLIKGNETTIIENKILKHTSTSSAEKIRLSNHITGAPLQWIFGWIVLLFILCLLLYRKD